MKNTKSEQKNTSDVSKFWRVLLVLVLVLETCSMAAAAFYAALAVANIKNEPLSDLLIIAVAGAAGLAWVICALITVLLQKLRAFALAISVQLLAIAAGFSSFQGLLLQPTAGWWLLLVGVAGLISAVQWARGKDPAEESAR